MTRKLVQDDLQLGGRLRTLCSLDAARGNRAGPVTLTLKIVAGRSRRLLSDLSSLRLSPPKSSPPRLPAFKSQDERSGAPKTRQAAANERGSGHFAVVVRFMASRSQGLYAPKN